VADIPTVDADGTPVTVDLAAASDREDKAIIVVAAKTDPVPIIFESEQTMNYEWYEERARARGAVDESGRGLGNPFTPEDADVVFGSQVEILGMLQRADAQFTLLLQPQEGAETFVTPGFSMHALVVPLAVRDAELRARLDEPQ